MTRSPLLRAAALSAGIASVLITLSVRAAQPQGSGRINPATVGVVPGARVRLIVADYGDKPQVGTISAVRGDSIVFHREATGDSAILGLGHIGQLELSRGRHSRPLAGLGIGLLGGAALGAGVGAATNGSSSGPYNVGGGAGVGALSGALAGAAGGALIGLVGGALSHPERWDMVQLDRLLEHTHVGATVLPSRLGPPTALHVAARF